MANPNPTPEKEKAEKQAKVEISIVRLAGRDINGNLSVKRSLTKIKGIGYNMSNALSLVISRQYGIDINRQIGSLNEEEVGKVEELLKDPSKTAIPRWLFNRRNDIETGLNMHVIGTDLIVKVKQDVDNDIKMQTWRGSRHRYGQKVRGQRTRSTGRTGATVGVTKKAVQEQQKAARAAEKGGGATAAGGAEKKP